MTTNHKGGGSTPSGRAIDLSSAEWRLNEKMPGGLFEYWLPDGTLLGWITQRPAYCDRGHWQAGIEIDGEFDWADGFPRYYMEEATAKHEIELFLNWRFNRVRAEPHKYPSIIDVIVSGQQ